MPGVEQCGCPVPPPPDETILPAIRSTLTDVDGKTVQLIF